MKPTFALLADELEKCRPAVKKDGLNILVLLNYNNLPPSRLDAERHRLMADFMVFLEGYLLLSGLLRGSSSGKWQADQAEEAGSSFSVYSSSEVQAVQKINLFTSDKA